jgi:hypothetical protein
MAGPSSPLPEPMIALSGWSTSPLSLPMPVKPCRASSTSTPHQSSATSNLPTDGSGCSRKALRISPATFGAGAEGRLGHPLRPGRRPVQPEGCRHGMEVEAELVHRCHRGSHRPSRPGTLPRQAHGRRDRRGEEQPRGHALAPQRSARCHPKSGKSRSGSAGNSVKWPLC